MSRFRSAHHLPNLRGAGDFADPNELPRQRRGITPQMHGRYPDYDVLEEQDHWDEATRKVVLERIHDVPAIRFFDARETETLSAFCDVLMAQDTDPRIPVLNFIDQKHSEASFDGYQYFDLPDDRELWRLIARGLDDEARRRGAGSFPLAEPKQQAEICHDFSKGQLHGGVWGSLNVGRAWEIVMRDVCQSFYSHPWAWNEIGFGGPAYPRGYSRFGSPHLQGAETETWEAEEAVDIDPVDYTSERGLD
jgi:hypothetical protein